MISNPRRRVLVKCKEDREFLIEVLAEDEATLLAHIEEAMNLWGVIKLRGTGMYAQWGVTMHLIQADKVIGVTVHDVV